MENQNPIAGNFQVVLMGNQKEANVINLHYETKHYHQRRSKIEGEGRTFKCQVCEKKYLSYPALYTHTKTKHKETKVMLKIEKDKSLPIAVKSRGRPKQQIGRSEAIIQEFFHNGEKYHPPIEHILSNILDKAISLGYSIKLDKSNIFALLDAKIQDLSMINKNLKVIKDPDEKQITITEIIAKYLKEADKYCDDREITNVLTTLLFFRESLNSHGWLKRFQLYLEDEPKIEGNYIYLSSAQEQMMETEFSEMNNGELIPDLVNEFLANDKNKWKNILPEFAWMVSFLENFCSWLFIKGYTCGKLSRIIYPKSSAP